MMRFIVTGELPGTSVRLSFITCLVAATFLAALFCFIVIKSASKLRSFSDKN